jgi:hypothetical protein
MIFEGTVHKYGRDVDTDVHRHATEHQRPPNFASRDGTSTASSWTA